MCGIVGFSSGWDEQILTRMNQAIHHRGPDDVGHFFDHATGVGLAARRLAVLDIPGGHQPMSDTTGRYHLVFNGEIYNAAALRAELRKQGYPLTTSHSDTESLLYLYIAYGPAMLDRFNGMFAFVIYDRVELSVCRERVFHAR